MQESKIDVDIDGELLPAISQEDSEDNELRQELLGKKFAKLSVSQRIEVIEASLMKAGNSISSYKREKLKKWIKKLKRIQKNANPSKAKRRK